MPTPGPWQDEMPLTIPGVVTQAGRYRWGLNTTETFHPGVVDAVEVDAVFNVRRLTTDGGEVGSGPGSGGGAEFSAGCEVSAFYIDDVDGEGTVIQRGEAFDQGWFLSANLSAGWATYIGLVEGLAFGAGASGYEIEGGSSLHIVSVDAVDASIPLVLSGSNAPTLTMNVEYYTAPAETYTSTPTAITPREARSVATSYPVESTGGTEPQAPLDLSLAPPAFDPTAGGLHVYPVSSQELSEDWATGGYAGRSQIRSEISLYSEGTVTLTYDVTFPRYRLLFDEEIPTTVPSVTRQWPRDDALGSMGSGTRIYPPPRRGRVYPAQQ